MATMTDDDYRTVDVLSDARDTFTAFVSHPHSHPYSYRLDTWQLWPTCDGRHRMTKKRPFGCVNPGIFIMIDLDNGPETPFCAMLGPWPLMYSGDLEYLFDLTVERLAPAVMVASVHLHTLGFPCYEECSACCEDLEE